MGYYSTMSYEVMPGTKVEPFTVSEDTLGFDGKEVEWYGFEGAEVDEDGCIDLGDYYSKFYDDKDFAKLLASKMKKGRVKLMFTGEGGERWSYTIEPNAVVEEDEDSPNGYFLDNGRELYVRLLEEKIEELENGIDILKRKIKANS